MVDWATLFSRSARYSSSARSGSIGSRLIGYSHANPIRTYAQDCRLEPLYTSRPNSFDTQTSRWFSQGFAYSQTGCLTENQSPIDTIPSFVNNQSWWQDGTNISMGKVSRQKYFNTAKNYSVECANRCWRTSNLQ